LNLFNFQVESVVEAPDPDDFESLDAFRETIALWDSQHPIDISLDSFSYWAPCPDDWYEPVGVENSPGVDRVLALFESSDTLAARSPVSNLIASRLCAKLPPLRAFLFPCSAAIAIALTNLRPLAWALVCYSLNLLVSPLTPSSHSKLTPLLIVVLLAALLAI